MKYRFSREAIRGAIPQKWSYRIIVVPSILMQDNKRKVLIFANQNLFKNLPKRKDTHTKRPTSRHRILKKIHYIPSEYA